MNDNIAVKSSVIADSLKTTIYTYNRCIYTIYTFVNGYLRNLQNENTILKKRLNFKFIFFIL